MTFDAFISKWTNQPVDFDGVYPNQCMDLMHQYVYDVLGLTDKNILAQPAAYQVYTNFFADHGNQYFDQIANTPDGVPQKGDIVLFGTDIGAYGHVCIFISGDQNSFVSFDANWPIGSLPHEQSHSYSGVLGWLHPKEGASDPLTACLAQHTELVNQCNAKDVTIESLTKEANTYANTITEKNAEIDLLNRRILALTSTTPPTTDAEAIVIQNPKGQIASQQTLISKIRGIAYGQGWPWVRLSQIKGVFTQAGA